MFSKLPSHDDEFFRALIDAAPDGFIIVSQEGRIVLVNLQIEKLFGYGRAELIDKPIEILVPERFRGKHRGHRAAFMGYQQLRPMGKGLELFGLRKDGTEFPVEISLSPLQTDSVTVVSAAVRDITDRKRIEERFRTLLDSAPDAMVIVNQLGKIVLVNSQTEKLFGYQREELLNQPVEVLVPERFWAEHGKHRNLYVQHTQVRPMGVGLDLYGLRKDGTEFPVEISLSPQHTDEGILVSSTIRDVTQRKRIEDSLRQSEASFRAMVEDTYGVYRAAPDGTILMANLALAKILGYDSERELKSRNLAADIFVEDDFAACVVEPPGLRKQFVRLESRWRRKDATIITVEISSRPVRDSAGQLLYFEALIEDVSHQRSVEHRLRNVQKMEAIGRLAGGIAHDFNNVLGVISGYAEMLSDLAESNAQIAAMTRDILKATERGGSLTRQLLAFSRQQVLQPRVINIADHIRNIQDLLARVLGEDIQLSVDTGQQPIHLRADPAQLEQVIMNLIVNARDAMPFGGRLSIHVSEVSLDEEYCSRNVDAAPGNYAVLAIGDTGSGMTPEVQARLFEPFFTTKDSGKGTGLGLATVYGIVKQTGGHITVYSEVGQGTTFKVHFPLSTEVEWSKEAPPVTQHVPSGSETILLVEDEDSMRQLTATYLEGKGYVVLRAADPDTAISLASAHPDLIHLLLTDVILPGMSGVKLAERLTSSRPNLRVLYMSGYTADALVHHGGQASTFAFLSKPFSLSSLARKLRVVLDENRSETASNAYAKG